MSRSIGVQPQGAPLLDKDNTHINTPVIQTHFSTKKSHAGDNPIANQKKGDCALCHPEAEGTHFSPIEQTGHAARFDLGHIHEKGQHRLYKMSVYRQKHVHGRFPMHDVSQ